MYKFVREFIFSNSGNKSMIACNSNMGFLKKQRQSRRPRDTLDDSSSGTTMASRG